VRCKIVAAPQKSSTGLFESPLLRSNLTSDVLTFIFGNLRYPKASVPASTPRTSLVLYTGFAAH